MYWLHGNCQKWNSRIPRNVFWLDYCVDLSRERERVGIPLSKCSIVQDSLIHTHSLLPPTMLSPIINIVLTEQRSFHAPRALTLIQVHLLNVSILSLSSVRLLFHESAASSQQCRNHPRSGKGRKQQQVVSSSHWAVPPATSRHLVARKVLHKQRESAWKISKRIWDGFRLSKILSLLSSVVFWKELLSELSQWRIWFCWCLLLRCVWPDAPIRLICWVIVLRLQRHCSIR